MESSTPAEPHDLYECPDHDIPTRDCPGCRLEAIEADIALQEAQAAPKLTPEQIEAKANEVVGFLFRCPTCGRSRELHSQTPPPEHLKCYEVSDHTTDFPDGGSVRIVTTKPHPGGMVLIKSLTAIDINPFARELA